MADAYSQAIGVALNDAKSMLGKNEVPDRADIMSYLRDGGQNLDPHQVAWCAAFVSASLQKAGLPVPTQVVKDSAFGPGAYAPNYLTYGNAVAPKDIQAGDVLVANNGGHVGFAEGPMRQGANGPEVQLLAGNQRDPSGQYAPGTYTNPRTGAVANRQQVGMVGEQWVPLSQYSARRYQPADDQSAGSQPARPGQPASSGATAVTASTPFSLSAPASGIPSAGQYQPMIDAAAAKYNLNPNFLSRLLWQENRFKPEGTSSAGAQGFAQFMPGTAARYGVDVHDPGSSIEGAAHYLSDLSTRYGGNMGLMAAGYNWGEGNVDKWLQGKAAPPSETTAYVNTITGHSMDDWRADPRLPLGGSTGPGRAPTGPAAAPGTTINTAAAGASSGVLPGFGTKEASDQFLAGLKQAGITPQTGDQAGQQPDMRPSPIMQGPGLRNAPGPAGVEAAARQLSPQLTGYSPGLYGQSLNSQPLAWGSSPLPPPPWLKAGAQQPAAQGYGTNLNSLQVAGGLSPYQLQMMMNPMMLDQG